MNKIQILKISREEMQKESGHEIEQTIETLEKLRDGHFKTIITDPNTGKKITRTESLIESWEYDETSEEITINLNLSLMERLELLDSDASPEHIFEMFKGETKH